MDILEYIKRYMLSPEYGKRGWYQSACKFIANETGASIRTVQKWGSMFDKCPEWVNRFILSRLKLRLVSEVAQQITEAEDIDALRRFF